MTARILPVSEWPRLSATDLGPYWTLLKPSDTDVMVVEAPDGAIVGCLAMLKVFHVEGLWIAPEHRRKGAVMRRLIDLMGATAAEHDACRVVGGAESDEMRAILAGLQAEALPAQFAIPMRVH